jgi:hypothetical protein
MMRGKFIKDWDVVNFKDATHRKQLSAALQYFLALPDLFVPKRFDAIEQFKKDRTEFRGLLARAQEFATTADFPASILPLIEKFHSLPLYDNGYEMIFDVRDFSGSARNGFDILDVESGLTFRRIAVGDKLDVFAMSGTLARVYFSFYGGALGWHRQLFDDKEYWTIEDNAIAFRNNAYQFRASVYYALIEAVGAAQNIAWQASPDTLAPGTRGYLASRDAATMNAAAQNIILNCANKGYGLTPANANFIVLCPLQLRGRVKQALAFNMDNFTESPTQVDYKFTQVTTTMLATTDVYYVILPKNKLKAGYRMDLTLFSDFDILSYTDTQAGWMRYGGAIGDTEQIQRCAIA